MINIYSLSIIFCSIFLLSVINLVRKNRIHERYSLLWICFAIGVLIISSSKIFIEKLANFLDIKYAPSVLFLLGLVYLLMYCLHITTIVSQHTDRINTLAQELALLKQKLGLEDKNGNDKQ